MGPAWCCAGCFIPVNLNNLASSTAVAQTWQTYETTTLGAGGTGAVDVTVRSERDPYLYFLDISKGLRDFGLKRTEKVRARGCVPGTCGAGCVRTHGERARAPAVSRCRHVCVNALHAAESGSMIVIDVTRQSFLLME